MSEQHNVNINVYTATFAEMCRAFGACPSRAGRIAAVMEAASLVARGELSEAKWREYASIARELCGGPTATAVDLLDVGMVEFLKLVRSHAADVAHLAHELAEVMPRERLRLDDQRLAPSLN